MFLILGVLGTSKFSVKLKVMWQKDFYEKILKPSLKCPSWQLLFIPNQEEDVAADLVRQKLLYFFTLEDEQYRRTIINIDLNITIMKH